jgi:DNA-directed RNA polymerase specialized sigma24 family protein
MADDYKPQQGDEAELFGSYNDELMRRVHAVVRTSDAIVEDACSIAWTQFLRHQPDRSRSWRTWLLTTAVREAWSLDRQRRQTRSLGATSEDGWIVVEPVDPRDQFGLYDELDAAVQVLEQLPPRLQRIAFLRATGHRYREISEITGDSGTRVNHLVQRANTYIREALQELDDPVVSAPRRATRLRQLEESPPNWLVRELGRPPVKHRLQRAYGTRILSWRRAALAIETYRELACFDSEDRALGLRPRDERSAEAFDAAVRAIEIVGRERAACRDLGS